MLELNDTVYSQSTLVFHKKVTDVFPENLIWWVFKKCVGYRIVQRILWDSIENFLTFISKRRSSPLQILNFSKLIKEWPLACKFSKFKYSQTCPNGHLWITATCQQRPVCSPNGQSEAYLPLIFLYKPLHNGHVYQVPKAAVVHRFDCTCQKFTIFGEYSNLPKWSFSEMCRTRQHLPTCFARTQKTRQHSPTCFA
jgi:hypothetical protein